MNKMVTKPSAFDFIPLPEQQPMKEIVIEEDRTKAAAAEVGNVDGKWKAVRLDGKPTLEDRQSAPKWAYE